MYVRMYMKAEFEGVFTIFIITEIVCKFNYVLTSSTGLSLWLQPGGRVAICEACVRATNGGGVLFDSKVRCNPRRPLRSPIGTRNLWEWATIPSIWNIITNISKDCQRYSGQISYNFCYYFLLLPQRYFWTSFIILCRL